MGEQNDSPSLYVTRLFFSVVQVSDPSDKPQHFYRPRLKLVFSCKGYTGCVVRTSVRTIQDNHLRLIVVMSHHVASATAGGYHDLKKDYNYENWKTEKAEYTQLANGYQSLIIDGQAVMESWEKPYMQALAEVATRSGGRVLEVGFGLYLSANSIQAHEIEEHIIIEANVYVIENAKEWVTKQKHKVTVMEGPWQEQVALLEDESLDGILYDAYPMNEAEQHTHQFNFLKQAYRKLKPGGVITYCNLTSIGVLHTQYPDWNELFEKTQKPHILDCGFKERDIKSFELCPVSPPDDCRYYHHKEAMYPIIIKS